MECKEFVQGELPNDSFHGQNISSRMGGKRNAYRLLVGKPEGKRPLGRPGSRWVDNVRMDLGVVGWDDVDWIGLAQDRNRWRALVNSVLNLRIPGNPGKLSSGAHLHRVRYPVDSLGFHPVALIRNQNGSEREVPASERDAVHSTPRPLTQVSPQLSKTQPPLAHFKSPFSSRRSLYPPLHLTRPPELT
jgi:hypothetical protein